MFWVEDLLRAGEISPYGQSSDVTPRWREAQPLRVLTESELLDALDQGLGNTRERLLHLRVRAWWLANESCRQRRAADACPSSNFSHGSRGRANLESLVDLLDEADDAESLMKVEALRELHRPDEARTLIKRNRPKQHDLVEWLARLTELVSAGDAQVGEVRSLRLP